MKLAFQIVFILLLAAWAGVIAGVSLLATPVKFQAHLLTMQAGLEVGRYTFRWLAHIEIGFLLATAIAASIAQPCRFAWVAVAAVIIAVLLQRYWLLPALDTQVGNILAGGPISFSYHHVLYAILEIVKICLLVAAGAIELYYRVKAAGLGRVS